MEYNKTNSSETTSVKKGKAGDSRDAVGEKVKVEKKANKGRFKKR